LAPSSRQKFVEKRDVESSQERVLRCSYFLQCAFYKDGSPYCSDQPASCPKWREHKGEGHETSDFSDNLIGESAHLAKAVHVITPYGKFEHNLHLYEFEVVGDELVVYPLDGSGGSFHYRGSFLYYVEGEYRR
jgi:hypothetical protein